MRTTTMSPAMVNALLNHKKLTLRVPFSEQPSPNWSPFHLGNVYKRKDGVFVIKDGQPIVLGYGVSDEKGVECYVSPCQIGAKIWVKEAFNIFILPKDDGEPLQVSEVPSEEDFYDGDYWGRVQYSLVYQQSEEALEYQDCYFRPASKMPKYLSRITLQVIGIKVERLQDITPLEAIEEGSYLNACPCRITAPPKDLMSKITFHQSWCHLHGDEFQHYWDKSHKKKGQQWKDNPFVWVYDIKPIVTAVS